MDHPGAMLHLVFKSFRMGVDIATTELYWNFWWVLNIQYKVHWLKCLISEVDPNEQQESNLLESKW